MYNFTTYPWNCRCWCINPNCQYNWPFQVINWVHYHIRRFDWQSNKPLEMCKKIVKNHSLNYPTYCKPCWNLFLVSSINWPHN